MTSGLPPDVLDRRRAGVLPPVAVPFAGLLPFFADLLGTVLLSVVLCAGAGRAGADGRRRDAPLGGPR